MIQSLKKLALTTLAFTGLTFTSLFVCAHTEVSKSSHQVIPRIQVQVVAAVVEDLEEFLQGQTAESIDNFDRPKSRRDMVDYILLRQALAAGLETPAKIEVITWEGASYNRAMSNLKQGKYTIFSNTVWREDFASSSTGLYVSSPVLHYGELQAGLYMNPNNPKFSAQPPLNLSQLSAVSSKQWRPDWQALQGLSLKHLYNEVNWEHMLKMVHSQRADFMLIPFSRANDLNYSAIGITLLPYPGHKISLAGSRGWAISHKNAAGDLSYRAITKGLKILRQSGVVPRAYAEAGVINTQVQNWSLLNSEQMSAAKH